MDRRQLIAIERWNVLFASLLVLASAILFPVRTALGVAVGAILTCANFFAFHRLLDRSMKSPNGRKRLFLQILLLLKMGAILVLVFLAIHFLPLSPVALAVGLSVFLLSIAVESVRFALGQKVDDGRA